MSDWLSVNESLPDTTRKVMVVYNGNQIYSPKNGKVIFAHYSNGEWRFSSPTDKQCKSSRVSYWQEIPNPPDI